MSRCILFALHREAAPFLRRLPRPLRIPGESCPAWRCDSLLILETGVGQQRCLAALRWLLDSDLPRPREVICAGFAGALEPGWTVGDVLFADDIIDAGGQRWNTADRGGGGRRGGLLTMPTMIGDPDEKRRLGLKHRAVAVEMESAAAARFCQEQGLPFRGIRAISDDVSTTLSPRLLDLLGGARVSIPRLILGVLRQPGLIGELRRLARDTRIAAANLATALLELPTIQPE
jgi:adenosylhomocysteine nucleosidase